MQNTYYNSERLCKANADWSTRDKIVYNINDHLDRMRFQGDSYIKSDVPTWMLFIGPPAFLAGAYGLLFATLKIGIFLGLV